MSIVAITGSPFTYYLPGLEDQANPGLLKSAPTIAAGDFTISTNGGAFEAMDNTPTVAPAGGKQIKFILSAAETTAAGDGGNITIECSDESGAEWFDVGITVAVRAADLSVLTAAGVNVEVVDVLRTDTIPDSYAADGAQPTIAQAILAIQQYLQERSVIGTTVTVKKPDGSTAAMTFTVDDADNPTSQTRAS